MLLYEDELIEVTWTNPMKKHYESFGYVFTKIGDQFKVKQCHISRGSGLILKAKCDYCGRDYTPHAYQYWNSRKVIEKDACCNCAGQKNRDVSLIKRRDRIFDKMEKFCKSKGYVLLMNKSEYIDTDQRVKYICPSHGIQETTVDILQHQHGCLKCKYDAWGDKKRHSPEFVKSVIESINGNIWLNPDGYTGINDRNLRIQCGTCGEHEYITSFGNYYYHDVVFCPHCSARQPSDGEKIIAEILDEYNIKHITEMRFDDCRDKRVLPFDFYLPDCNLIIEFDGPQHFEEKDGWTDLEITQRHDQIKNKYCETHGIDLLRIPFWEGHNIEKIILEKITGKRYDLVS